MMMTKQDSTTFPSGCQYLVTEEPETFCGRAPIRHWIPRPHADNDCEPYVFCKDHHDQARVIDNWEEIYEYAFITHYFPYDD